MKKNQDAQLYQNTEEFSEKTDKTDDRRYYKRFTNLTIQLAFIATRKTKIKIPAEWENACNKCGKPLIYIEYIL